MVENIGCQDDIKSEHMLPWRHVLEGLAVIKSDYPDD